jgi:hypothetical protein
MTIITMAINIFDIFLIPGQLKYFFDIVDVAHCGDNKYQGQAFILPNVL